MPYQRFVFVLIIALSAGSIAWAEQLTGKVIGIVDGDTLTILDAQHKAHRVRIAGIDAPEKGQPFGARAKAALAGLAYRQPALVDWHKRDRYDRLVGRVCIVPAQCQTDHCSCLLDVGLAQLEAGMAWWYRQYAKEQSNEEVERYAKAEERAREGKVGLWSDTHPIPPWVWRKRHEAFQ